MNLGARTDLRILLVPAKNSVVAFATYFHRSPDQLGPDLVREYRVQLFRDRKLSPHAIEGQTVALRFLFVKALRRF